MKIILDTNFLVYCAKQKIDYAEEIRVLASGKYNLATPSQVIEELQKIAKSAKKYSDKESAKLALKLLKVNKVKTLRIIAKNADNAIVKASAGNIVATVDKLLQKRLEKVIIIKAKKKLAFR